MAKLFINPKKFKAFVDNSIRIGPFCFKRMANEHMFASYIKFSELFKSNNIYFGLDSFYSFESVYIEHDFASRTQYSEGPVISIEDQVSNTIFINDYLIKFCCEEKDIELRLGDKVISKTLNARQAYDYILENS